MQLIRPRLSHDDHLAAWVLPIFGTIRVTQQVELSDRVHPQQLLAGTTRLHVILCRPSKLNAVQEKQVLLRAISCNREIVTRCGIRHSNSSSLFPVEVDYYGVQREQ